MSTSEEGIGPEGYLEELSSDDDSLFGKMWPPSQDVDMAPARNNEKLKYLLHYVKLCNLQMGVQKLHWLKVNTFKGREDIFHDGKTMIRKVLDETSQRKIHDARLQVKRDLMMKKVEENTTTLGQMFGELQNCVHIHMQEHFVELKWWNGNPDNKQGVMNKMRTDIVQVVALAKQNTKAEWRVKFKNWSSWQQRKFTRKQIKMNEKRAPKEALREDFQAELEFDDQLRSIRRLLSRMNNA